MSLVKIILNAVVSEDSIFGTLDVRNFYYGADIFGTPPSIRIPLRHYSPSLLSELGLTPFVQTDRAGHPFLFADVKKCIPGLPQSGLLSQLRLLSHLESHGYHETDTPMLFRHVSRPISFTLVVDDFGIKYSDIVDYEHLRACLEEQYEVTGSPVGTQYLGYSISHDRPSRTISLSIPGYIAKLLQSVRPDGVKHSRSPFIYEGVVYGSTAPQISPVDSSPPATAAEAKTLQQVVGSLLYYARAVDYSMLPAVAALSALQSLPTTATISKMERLLGYAAAFPNASLTIRPSDMLLRIHSDASHLSRPKSGSVAGGFHYLGTSDPLFLNAGIHCHSTLIPVVTAAVSESEYAGVFANGQIAVDEVRALGSLGYPQPPPVILCDNECAVGLATDTVRAKKSKSIDMRFDWIRDRVRQGQLLVSFLPGVLNLGDFFTKSLPVHTHASVSPLFVSHAPSN